MSVESGQIGTSPPAGGPGSPGTAGAIPSRRRHTARWVAGAVIGVLVVVSVIAATRPTYQATEAASPLVGTKAPPFTATDLAGQRVSLAGYRGRYVYVNFFASWCPPCHAEEPDLVAFDFQQQKLGRSGAAVLSVVFNDTAGAAAKFVNEYGAEWPAVLDNDGTIANEYGVGSPPMTFLVNPRGTVVGVWDGPVKEAQLDTMLREVRSPGG